MDKVRWVRGFNEGLYVLTWVPVFLMFMVLIDLLGYNVVLLLILF